MSNALQITDLFVLSDVLQMELHLTPGGVISGEIAKSIEIPELGLKMNLKPKVVSSKVHWSVTKGKVEPVIALLVQVQGDLFLMAGNDKARDRVLVLVLDQARISEKLDGLFERHKGKEFGPLMTILNAGKVAEFEKSEYGTSWKTLTLAKAA